jgi:hypothetical protein
MTRRTHLLLLAALTWPLFDAELPDRPRVRPQPIVIALRDPTSLQVGQTAQLVLLTEEGDSMPGRVTWAASDAEIAASTPGAAFITGTEPGTAAITATSEGLSGSAFVTVTAPERAFSWKDGAAFCGLARCDRIVVGAAKQLRSQYDYYRWRNRRRIGFLLGALAAVALGLVAVRRRTRRQLAPA